MRGEWERWEKGPPDLAFGAEPGERLCREDAARLWRVPDLTSLAVLADRRRQATSGRDAYYRLSLHAAAGSGPASACPYCALRVNRALPDETSLTEFLAQCDPAIPGELHLGGELANVCDLEAACGLVRQARRLRPRLRIRAVTWKDVRRWSGSADEFAGRVLAALADCGLAAMAGEAVATRQPGADPTSTLPAEDVQPWLAAAAEAGLRSELTWIVGADEDADPVADLLIRLRDSQDRYGVLDCLTPFPCPTVGERGERLELTGYQWMKSVAVARIVLDNIPHVRICAGVTADALVQLAQWYGADDAGTALFPFEPEGGGGVAEERLRRLMLEAGVRPVNVVSEIP